MTYNINKQYQFFQVLSLWSWNDQRRILNIVYSLFYKGPYKTRTWRTGTKDRLPL